FGLRTLRRHDGRGVAGVAALRVRLRVLLRRRAARLGLAARVLGRPGGFGRRRGRGLLLLGHLARFRRAPRRLLRDGAGLLAGSLPLRRSPPPGLRLLLAPGRLVARLLRRRALWWLRSLWRTHRGPSPWRRAVGRSKHSPEEGHGAGRP